MNQSEAAFHESTFEIPISIVMEKIAADQKWSLDRWRLVGAVLENGRKPKGEIFKSQGRRMFCWPGFRLGVHTRHVKSYAANLQTGNPKLFVICRNADDGIICPVAISADIDEAASYMEADEPVFSCCLPEPAVVWLEHFTLQNQSPGQFHKRRRTAWYTSEVRDTENVYRT